MTAEGKPIDFACLGPCFEVLRRVQPTPSPATLDTAAKAAATSNAARQASPASVARRELMYPPLAFGQVNIGWSIQDLLALSDTELWELRRDCAMFGLLCFRRVAGMSSEGFGRFMARWGRIERDYDVLADASLEPSAPADVAPAVFGNGGKGEHLYADPSWHFDGEDLPWLHSYTSLFCLRAPHAGHTTKFAVTGAAASHLPVELLARLDGAYAQYSSFDIGNVEVPHDDNGPQLKPVLRLHKHFGLATTSLISLQRAPYRFWQIQ